MCICEVNT